MKKRSKKRIPQDVKPWARIAPEYAGGFTLPIRQTTRWVEGARRDWGTKVLANAAKHEILRVALRSSIASYAGFPRTPRVTLALAKLTHRVRSLSKLTSITRYKHFCLLLGRGRTYSRSIGLARHSFRKLAGTGFISGLYKW